VILASRCLSCSSEVLRAVSVLAQVGGDRRIIVGEFGQGLLGSLFLSLSILFQIRIHALEFFDPASRIGDHLIGKSLSLLEHDGLFGGGLPLDADQSDKQPPGKRPLKLQTPIRFLIMADTMHIFRGLWQAICALNK